MPRPFAVSLLLLATLIGCAHRSEEGPREVIVPASATTAPAGRTQAQVIKMLTGDRSIAREYYMGDHLGTNLHLLLLAGGGYSLQWTGCQGLYGAATGQWRLEGDHVVLRPGDEQGRSAEYPLRKLHIRVMPGTRFPPDVALVPEAELSTFTTEGVRDWTCFRPSDIVLLDWLR
jgi:hypothetical protein